MYPRSLERVAVLCLLLGSFPVLAQDEEEKKRLAAQHAIAEENCKLLELGEVIFHETKYLRLCAPKELDPGPTACGELLEKARTLAAKSLGLKEEESAWPGKLTVYLLPGREQFASFVRRVERRRLEPDEVGSFAVVGEAPHIAVSPPRAKTDLPVEMQAVAQVAAALMARKAGSGVIVSGWLQEGFGRATVWRVAGTNRALLGERRQAARLVQSGKTAPEVWDNQLDVETACVLRASLADYLAYGPGRARFPAIVEGFKPGEGQQQRGTGEALQAAEVTPDRLNAVWRRWALAGRP